MIEVENVSVSYDDTDVLRDLSISVAEGSWFAIIGPNGAGKTTLIRAIAGLVDFDGRIAFHGRPSARSNRRELARLVAVVPQQPFIPRASVVVDYVLMGRTAYIPYFGVESKNDLDVVGTVLERLDLGGLAERQLGSLSGGELQRVVLARALAQQAPILLLDEPTTALDVGHQQHVLELVDSLRHDHELTVVSSMHDLTLAAQFSDRLALLSGGRKIVEGDARTVLTRETIARYFAADVRIIEDAEGGILVVPRRMPRPAARSAGVG
jgi:iron complex transport system ATP-binding protein